MQCAIFNQLRMHYKFVIILLLFPFLSHSQVQIEGKVLDKIKGTPLPNRCIILSQFDRDTVMVIDSTEFHPFRESYTDSVFKRCDRIFVDSNSNFLFRDLPTGVYKITALDLRTTTPIGFFYQERESVIISAKVPGEVIEPVIYLSVFCPYDSTRDMTVCPKCGKDDKLRIFVWGLPEVNSHFNDQKYIYTGDCSPPRCVPSKYCVRCKLEF